jgi:hypothetical protein
LIGAEVELFLKVSRSRKFSPGSVFFSCIAWIISVMIYPIRAA